jgi:hypothetical protein
MLARELGKNKKSREVKGPAFNKISPFFVIRAAKDTSPFHTPIPMAILKKEGKSNTCKRGDYFLRNPFEVIWIGNRGMFLRHL